MYDLNIHKRKSIRLNNYDYTSEWCYFITICVQWKMNIFGDIENNQSILNDAGRMVYQQWLWLEQRFPHIQLHDIIIMPNHIHGIIEIVGAPLVGIQHHNISEFSPVGVPLVGTQNNDTSKNHDILNPSNIGNQNTTQGKHKALPLRESIGDIVGAFKSLTTHEYIEMVREWNALAFENKLWQRNYYEHIIRDENWFNTIVEYIRDNPKKWEEDERYNN